ncbi:MAG: ATP-dependent DNA helicase [bacterium]|nr:ATP-dependent DNA helicase [bacterium]
MPISTEFQKQYSALNDEQRTAVDTLEGPVMVLAGPGTGKTQTLAMRIANILQHTQMDPWNILCLTFTESGVAAMRSRLLRVIGTPAYYVRIYTFHSFCNEILQDHPEIFATGNTWRLVSDAEKVQLFQTIVDTLPEGSPLKPFYAPYLYFSNVLGAIGELKQEDISPDAFREVIVALASLFVATKDARDTFFSLTPKQRTYEACVEFQELLEKACDEASIAESIAYALQQLFVTFEERHRNSDSAREQSKERTQLKNAVKKWFEVEGKNQERNMALSYVYEKYEQSLKTAGMYDYEDMISRVVAELTKNSDLLAEYQEEFQYILVDEYQDTNGGQNKVVALLGSFDDSPNIFVVGDDKQSIYRFQGASLANMLSFYERYKKSVRVISLMHNYRSQKTIIDASGSLVSHNSQSLGAHIPGIIERLVPGKDMIERKIAIVTTESEDQEAYVIGQHILQLLEQQVPAEDIAVLYRYNNDGNILLQTLRAMNIPARLEMGEDIFAEHCVQQWSALLRWLVGDAREDDIARIVQYAWWHIDSVDALRTIHYATANHIPLLTVLSNMQYLQKAEVQDAAAMHTIARTLSELQQASARMPLMEFLEHILQKTSWKQYMLASGDSVTVLRAMKRFLNEAKELSHTRSDYSARDFVQHLMFLQDTNIHLLTPAWEGGVGAVHLLSAHKAKGLEWPHVFVIRMNDKHWGNPKKRSGLALPEGLVKYDFVFLNDKNEDERRLFYVALTRAMHTVTLTRASHTATGKETVPSLFLAELPEVSVVKSDYVETPQIQEKRLLETMIIQQGDFIHEDAKAYIRSLLSHYVMSATHVNNYLECPRKFYWRNILQIPSTKTRSLMLGSAVHDSLRDVFELLKSGDQLPENKSLELLFEKYLRREAMSEADFNEIYSKGSKALLGYLQHYKNDFFTDVLTEYNFKKHRVQIQDVRITGKLDKIEIIDKDNKLVNVVDYKTGNSDAAYIKLKKDGNYFRQLVFYKILCDNAPQFGYTMQSGEIDFIEASKKGYIKKKIEITNQDVDQLTEVMQKVWSEIHELKFMDPESGCQKKECEYCG